MHFLMIATALYISNWNTDLLGQFVTTVNLNGVVHAFLFCIQMHAVFSQGFAYVILLFNGIVWPEWMDNSAMKLKIHHIQ